MSLDPEDKDSVARLLRAGLPLPDDHDAFITRAEFIRELGHFEKSFDTRMQLEVTKIQKWIFGGILAFILTVGGGGVAAYVSIITKLERIGEIATSAERANSRLDERRRWTVSQEQRDTAQDEELRRISPNYKPPVPVEIPE